MAQLGKTFDPNAQDPSVIGGSQLPISDKTGWPMVVIASEMKSTQNDANQGYLEVTLQIIDGEFKGAEGKERFNIFNNSEQAVKIAERNLTALAYSTGIFQPFADSAILHNRPFRGVVGPNRDEEKAKKGFTEIKGYFDINGNPPSKNGASQPAQQPSAPPQMPGAPPQAQAQPKPQAPPANVPWGQPAAPSPTPEQPATPTWAQNPKPSSAPPWQN